MTVSMANSLNIRSSSGSSPVSPTISECHDVFARGPELANDVAADVACSAGNKYRLVFHGLFVFFLSFRPEI
jgi:hypothetical protein